MQIRDAANILRNGYDEDYIKLWAVKLKIESLVDGRSVGEIEGKC